MEKKSFNVSFFCRKTRVSKKGKAPIYARITTSGVIAEFHIHCQVEPEKWNQTAERVMAKDSMSVKINEIITSYRTRIFDIYDQMIKEGVKPHSHLIRNRLFCETQSKKFLEELSKYCEKRQEEVGVRLTQLTANKYHRILRYLTEYTKVKYNVEDIDLDKINVEYIDGFSTFVQMPPRKCNNNGAVNLLCCLKNFMYYCERNEWIQKNPFKWYKMRYEKVTGKKPLELSEIERIRNKCFSLDRLDQVRDVFLFCCYTALAFTDVENLRKEHFFKDKNGRTWIEKPREKTSVVSNIPVLPPALELLEKYKDNTELKAKGKLLPVSTNQRMNAYLKEIAMLCGIEKNLTTHIARHSFATLAIEYGVPIDIIAKVLGHTNTNMTRRYAKISYNNIQKEMDKFGRIFEI